MRHTDACLSPNGGTVTTASDFASRLHVATLHGVVTLVRAPGTAAWTEAGRTLTDRHVSALLLEPASGKLFAAAHGEGGIAVSDDAGVSWRDVSAGLGHRNVYTLAVQYREAAAVLFAGVEPAKLYRSNDLGDTWFELPGPRDVPIRTFGTFLRRRTSLTSRTLPSIRSITRRSTPVSSKVRC